MYGFESIVCCVSKKNFKYKPDLFFTWHWGLCVYFWLLWSLFKFHILVSYTLRGPVSIIHVRFRIYSVLRFNKFFQIQTRFIFYVAWGPMCIFFGYCGHSYNFVIWALPFLFPTNDTVIPCVIWWGPVSISFLPANSIYKPPLCF